MREVYLRVTCNHKITSYRESFMVGSQEIKQIRISETCFQRNFRNTSFQLVCWDGVSRFTKTIDWFIPVLVGYLKKQMLVVVE